MTRGEAIMKLSSLMMQCGMLMPIEWVRQNGEGSPVQEAVIMAQNALREQEERSKGCEYCDKYDDPCGVPMIATEEDECDRGIYLYNGWICANGGSFCDAKVKFCPMCGRRLSE